MKYIVIVFVLFVLELVYFKLADRFNIVDKPNERSSHSQITLRGGGIIFWIAAVLYVVMNPSVIALEFLAGITLIAFVSFWDDVKGLNQKTRLLFHLLSMTCVFYLANIFHTYPWWIIVIGYIVFIGVVNAYNFMDGINGITGLYTLAVLLSMMWVNYYVKPFVDHDFLRYPFLASIVFLFFNFRKKAKCFAGDVGSVSVAFWVVTLLLLLIVKTQNLIWIGFLIVYGVDAVMTIIHRIYLRQNIMEAHRLHFYQVLANEQKMDHRVVSIIYFVAQIISSTLIIILYPTAGWWVFVAILIVLMGLYVIKFLMMNGKRTANAG